MRSGNWIPISKGLLKYLPKDRPYTKLEAALSLQADYDQGNEVTLTGYSNLWRWSKGKVKRFFQQMGIQIKYPKDTQRNRNQNGLIMILKTDLKQTKSGPIRLINSRQLKGKTDLKQTKNEQKTDLKQVTTKDPNTNPNIFSENSDELSLSKLLLDRIKIRDPKFKNPDLQKWAKHIDRLIRKDGRPAEEVRKIIEWSQKDDFWQDNILSTSGLRKKYTTLRGKALKARASDSGHRILNPEEVEKEMLRDE